MKIGLDHTVVAWIPAGAFLLAGTFVLALRRLRRNRSASIPLPPPTNWKRQAAAYGMAVLLAAAATLIRWWLDSLFGDLHASFITYYPAVLLVALIAGSGPGILATLLCAMAADYFFIPPYGFGIETAGDAVSMGIFTGTSLFICILADRLRMARWAEAFGLAKEQEAEELARQNQEMQSQARRIQSLNSELQHTLRRFELLAQTAGELLQSTEPQKVVESLCRKVMEHIGCHAFFNFMVDERAGRLRLNACAGIPPQEAANIEWLDFGVAVCGCAARDCTRIVAEHIPTTPDPRTELVKGFGIKAYACHPLMGPRGEVIGTLSFGTKSRETFSADDLSLMKAVADQVAIAMVRMKSERALRELADDLGRSNRELEQFAYVASHDLQEPLRMVEGFLTRLVDRYAGSLDERARQFIDFAVQGSMRMSQLVYSLLEYSRVQNSTLQASPTPMKEVLDHAVANCMLTVREAGASITSDELPTVVGDSTQLVRVLQNLISNAVKFRREGVQPQIHVSARRDATHWLFCVEDNGIGFPPEQAQRIFLIFQRLHTQDKYPGAGIGLSICKKIVERHGGRMWAESSPGVGSKFFFSFPA